MVVQLYARSRCGLAAVLLIAVTLVGGCSSYQLAYNNLDRLLLGYVEDYVELSSVQRQQILPTVRQWHRQHRQQQLPEYRQWLLEVRQAVNSTGDAEMALHRELDDKVAANWLTTIDESWLELRRGALPSALVLIEQLDPIQQQRLLNRLQQQLDKQWRQYHKRTAVEQAEHRYQIYLKRLQRWSGRLHNSQQQQLKRLVGELVDTRPLWLAYRQRWIDRLQQALALQAKPQHDIQRFRSAIETLVVASNTLQGDSLQRAMASNRQQWVRFTSRFINGLSAQQRDHFITELDSLIGDIEQLLS